MPVLFHRSIALSVFMTLISHVAPVLAGGDIEQDYYQSIEADRQQGAVIIKALMEQQSALEPYLKRQDPWRQYAYALTTMQLSSKSRLLTMNQEREAISLKKDRYRYWAKELKNLMKQDALIRPPHFNLQADRETGKLNDVYIPHLKFHHVSSKFALNGLLYVDYEGDHRDFSLIHQQLRIAQLNTRTLGKEPEQFYFYHELLVGEVYATTCHYRNKQGYGLTFFTDGDTIAVDIQHRANLYRILSYHMPSFYQEHRKVLDESLFPLMEKYGFNLPPAPKSKACIQAYLQWLQPSPAQHQQAFNQLLTALNADAYQEREQAFQSLLKEAHLYQKEIHNSMANPISLEVKSSLEVIQKKRVRRSAIDTLLTYELLDDPIYAWHIYLLSKGETRKIVLKHLQQLTEQEIPDQPQAWQTYMEQTHNRVSREGRVPELVDDLGKDFQHFIRQKANK